VAKEFFVELFEKYPSTIQAMQKCPAFLILYHNNPVQLGFDTQDDIGSALLFIFSEEDIRDNTILSNAGDRRNDVLTIEQAVDKVYDLYGQPRAASNPTVAP
jgi:hypothetical protein